MRPYQLGDQPVPGHTIVESLGTGRSGSVWKATNPAGLAVALKVLRPSKGIGINEFRALRLIRLVRHAHVLPLFDVWLKDDEGYLVDENIETVDFLNTDREVILTHVLAEGSLASRLKQCRGDGADCLPLAELLTFLGQAASAIDHLHEPIHRRGGLALTDMQHGNIKPSNLLISDGVVKLGDLGLIDLYRMSAARSTAFVNIVDPSYAAPEIITHKGPQPTSDQYALAMTYFELRGGKLPQLAALGLRVSGAVQVPVVDIGFLPATEQEVLRKALDAQPLNRFPSCRDFVAALEAATGLAAPAATAEPYFSPDREVAPGFRLDTKLDPQYPDSLWQATGPAGEAIAIQVVRDHGRLPDRVFEATRARLVHDCLLPIRETLPAATGRPTDPPYLLLVSELPLQSLAGRLDECLAHGEFGIPGGELIAALRGIAEALDFLNAGTHTIGSRPAAIDHGNLRPEFLVKMDDGRVRLTGLGAAVTRRGLTVGVDPAERPTNPYYDAPEVLRNWINKGTDQFALALVYVHLRTGTRRTAGELSVNDHWLVASPGRPDADRPRPGEQAACLRATRPEIDRRFRSCVDFIAALETAMSAPYEPPPAPTPVAPPEPVVEAPPEPIEEPPPPPTPVIDRFGFDSGPPFVAAPPPPPPAPTYQPPASLTGPVPMEPFAAAGHELVPGFRVRENREEPRTRCRYLAGIGPGGTDVTLVLRTFQPADNRDKLRGLLEELLPRLDHPHVLRLHAIWWLDGAGRLLPDADSGQASYLVALADAYQTTASQHFLTYRGRGEAGIAVPELLRIVRQVARALDHLNVLPDIPDGPRPFVHHKIRPDTIRLTRTGDAKIGYEMSPVREAHGSLYQAPEVLDGKFTRWSDQFSLAMTYYQLRTGRLPFDPKLPANHRRQVLEAGEVDLAGLTPTEDQVIRRGLHADPYERYASSRAFVRQLYTALGVAFPPLRAG